MSYNRQSEYEVNEEQLTSFLSDALKHVSEAGESEIQALSEIKKIFKKSVGLTRRNYVAAYLLKLATTGYRPRFNRDRNEKLRDNRRPDRFSRDRSESRLDKSDRREESRSEDRPERAPRVTIDPSVADTIFISIGRNRHVFPRDLVGLLISVAGLERERIGLIRVLANYSFVQLYKEDSEKAIKALDGYDYRGRKLTVNLSKQSDAVTVSENESESVSVNEENIPENVSNESEQTNTATTTFTESQPQYSETTDDGQVKSHFGDGAAY